MSPKNEAAKLLRNAWKRQKEFLTKELAPEEFVRLAPALIAREILKFSVEYVDDIREDVPSDRGVVTGVVAGILNKPARRISISRSLPIEARRFTLAHEIGHILMHPGVTLHRDRPIGKGAVKRDPIEREADKFAAHLLMPEKFLTKVFAGCFGGPLDGSRRDSDLAHALSIASGTEISESRLASLRPFDRAVIVAKVDEFKGSPFQPIHARFAVSVPAMAIQLLDLGLVA